MLIQSYTLRALRRRRLAAAERDLQRAIHAGARALGAVATHAERVAKLRAEAPATPAADIARRIEHRVKFEALAQ